MEYQDLKEKIEEILPLIQGFFESRGFEGIKESVDRDTGLPKLSTLAPNYDYQMSLTPKRYINADPDCELLFLKPSTADKYYHQRLITLRVVGQYWKLSYKGQEYYLSEQVLEAIYDDE